MAIYSSAPEVLPSLVFTKAELAYILTRLTGDIDANDNETGLEMVELRHYCNLIGEEIAAAAKKGELGIGGERPKQEAEKPKPAAVDMGALRRKFPTLSDEEIAEIVTKARAEKEKESPMPLPKPPSFIAERKVDAPRPLNGEEAPLRRMSRADRENAQKFSQLLG